MKRTYIVLVIIAALGIEAIILYPSKGNIKPAAPMTRIKNTNETADTTTGSLSQQSNNPHTLSDGSFKGATQSTPFGNVAISIIVHDGKITDVSLSSMPDYDHKSEQISQRAGSILISQTMAAQSSNIDGVSGASYTSEAYRNSLQAAIDSAKGA